MTPIQTNKPLFFADDGEALEGGQIYVGQPSTDPRTNPKTVTFRDSGGAEFTAKQPMETLAGRIVYNGKPIVALVNGEYSLLILDSAGKQLDYSRSVTPSGAAGDAIADFSEVIRVGLTLNEIQSFDVSVGDVVKNVGKATATDGLGSVWLAVSSTGTPADDVNLIDFQNGLQGQLISAAFQPKDYGTFEIGGDFAGSANETVSVYKIGRQVFISTFGVELITITASTRADSGAFLPEELRPTNSRGFSLFSSSNDGGFIDTISVNPNGSITAITVNLDGSGTRKSTTFRGEIDLTYTID